MNFFRSFKKKPTTPFEVIGGQATANKIAETFYDIMESDPLVADLLAIHPKPLTRIREVFALYLTMWLGGPNTYEQQFGHPRLRARHLPFIVTPVLKEQWMYCMRKAMFTHVSDKALANKLLASLNQLAEHMINKEE
ncbi:group II truncated hemoglobin [Alteromonas sp. ASW11-130]|uniref:group II truncated hemoglobin n=1 Tax=Alteromonas sp. ASW11-130 TaxID=3015775 RepID=UPI00224259F2|nr:group II truncated hemoglobin [Alteromonas sp. ASW11-130]MCW8093477.1 group II truncated hemoglobin [Alteromonas sp. ASW11-130]